MIVRTYGDHSVTNNSINGEKDGANGKKQSAKSKKQSENNNKRVKSKKTINKAAVVEKASKYSVIAALENALSGLPF